MDTTSKRQEVRRLLDSIGVLRHHSDLDLLVFFARHPQSLLTSETLASFLGYSVQQIAASLEVLLAAGLMARRQTPAHAARLYLFTAGGGAGDWLPPLLRLASTREGRLALRRELERDSSARPERAESRAATRRGPRGLVALPSAGGEAGAENQARTSPARRAKR